LFARQINMFNNSDEFKDPFLDFANITWILGSHTVNPFLDDNFNVLNYSIEKELYDRYLNGQNLLHFLAYKYYLLFELRTPKQNLTAYRLLANFWDDKVNSYEIDHDCVVTRLPYPFDPSKSDPLRDPAYPIYFLALLEIYDEFCEMQQHLMEQTGLLFKPEAC